MRASAIIAAGGRGTRFGGELKQLRLVGGRALLDRSVSAFLSHPAIAEVVVALPPALVDNPPDYLRGGGALRLVTGGDRRQDSVANAFRAADGASDIIVIHDAARPFVSADLIARTVGAAEESGAAIAALAARDTVKRARDHVVAETLARDTIFLAQTPQAFRRRVLQDALAVAERDGIDATDEAALAERAGHAVRIVDGDATNIKITMPEDLALAEAIYSRSAEASRSKDDLSEAARALRGAQAPVRTGRAGTGYDLHRLVGGRPLVVGGVTIPFERGALGHSDADVACHAITDAILGAIGLGDIGRHFSDADERWKDASSLDLLARVAAMAAERGYEVGNVDVTVILEAPKIGDHVDAMRRAIGKAIGIDAARVSVKGKTNEGVDAIGRGEAIAAHAVALVRAIGD
jgi:2-C-methyl-D-erythritol 4-phosphate cytidylyltransferase / 2-C-methyl-D-erythritol 2,4-cyclodiphosphate synthase